MTKKLGICALVILALLAPAVWAKGKNAGPLSGKKIGAGFACFV
jgi:hypothetical protein